MPVDEVRARIGRSDQPVHERTLQLRPALIVNAEEDDPRHIGVDFVDRTADLLGAAAHLLGGFVLALAEALGVGEHGVVEHVPSVRLVIEQDAPGVDAAGNLGGDAEVVDHRVEIAVPHRDHVLRARAVLPAVRLVLLRQRAGQNADAHEVIGQRRMRRDDLLGLLDEPVVIGQAQAARAEHAQVDRAFPTAQAAVVQSVEQRAGKRQLPETVEMPGQLVGIAEIEVDQLRCGRLRPGGAELGRRHERDCQLRMIQHRDLFERYFAAGDADEWIGIVGRLIENPAVMPAGVVLAAERRCDIPCVQQAPAHRHDVIGGRVIVALTVVVERVGALGGPGCVPRLFAVMQTVPRGLALFGRAPGDAAFDEILEQAVRGDARLAAVVDVALQRQLRRQDPAPGGQVQIGELDQGLEVMCLGVIQPPDHHIILRRPDMIRLVHGDGAVAHAVVAAHRRLERERHRFVVGQCLRRVEGCGSGLPVRRLLLRCLAAGRHHRQDYDPRRQRAALLTGHTLNPFAVSQWQSRTRRLSVNLPRSAVSDKTPAIRIAGY